MEKEGETAANWLKDQKLPEYNIIHIQGVMGSAAQKGRSGALADTAKSEGWNIVTEQNSRVECRESTADCTVRYRFRTGIQCNLCRERRYG